MAPSRQLTLITTLGVLSLLYCGTPRVSAQTVSVSDTLYVRFRPEKTELEMSYAANDRQIASFQDRHRALTTGLDIPSDALPWDTRSSTGEQPWCTILPSDLAPMTSNPANLAAADDSTEVLRLKVYFDRSLANLDPAFRGNGSRMQAFREILEARLRIGASVDSVLLRGNVSLEGTTENNISLSEARTHALDGWFADTLGLAEPELFRREAIGEDWKRLAGIISSLDVDWKEDALYIIERAPERAFEGEELINPRKDFLHGLKRGDVWFWLDENVFPDLRDLDVVVWLTDPPLPQTAASEMESKLEAEIKPSFEPVPALEPESESGAEAPAAAARRPFLAVQTNLLYDAAAIPNLGIEIFLGGLWSLTVDWNFAWWSNTGKNRSWQTYGGYLGARRYFGRLAETRRFSGHYAGLYVDALTYDFELGGTGYQAAKWGFGGGLEYGFSLPLNRSLNLDFSLGLGYQDGEYMTYEPRDGHDVWMGTYKRTWIGPTKVQIGLKWILGKQEKEGKP